MTREERDNALKVLKNYDLNFHKINGMLFSGEEIANAFDMAIKALEQEPCEDCVSRANLLKKFEDRFIELQKAHKKDMQLGVNWCINTLNDTPSVTPTHGTCKDCKYYRNKGKHSYCTKRLNVDSVTDRYREPNFYCADFEMERKE